MLFVWVLSACNQNNRKGNIIQTDANGYVILSDEEIDNIVKRSYQYVALYNVNNKFALSQGGWNTLKANTELVDHTAKEIARPNNDSFYTIIMLDLRKDAYVVDFPKFDSKYISLMVTAYDHYVNVPKSTRKGDFRKAEKILFYSNRTELYNGQPVEGVDNTFEANGDFISVIFRVMPHANEPDRFTKVVEQIENISLKSLSEYQEQVSIPYEKVEFPKVGDTDLDVFEDNFLEVMQFVLNHLTFDENDELDQEFLACLKPLGLSPGKTYDTESGVKIDGQKFRERAELIYNENLALLGDPSMAARLGPRMFRSKGQTDLEAVLFVSIVGPIGLPLDEAFYPGVVTLDGSAMNAQYDYVVKMTKDELPPAKAFWSLTLYDKANGFFIPNEQKKYSVGENAGMQLNEEGGIEIYIAAVKPDGVANENWLPINRGDENIDIVLRVYVPELDKLSSWKAPTAEKL